MNGIEAIALMDAISENGWVRQKAEVLHRVMLALHGAAYERTVAQLQQDIAVAISAMRAHETDIATGAGFIVRRNPAFEDMYEICPNVLSIGGMELDMRLEADKRKVAKKAERASK